MLSSYQLELSLRGERTDNVSENLNDLDSTGLHFGRMSLWSDLEDSEIASSLPLPLDEDVREPPELLPRAEAAEMQPPVTGVPSTGNVNIDSLLAGVKWGGAVHTGVTLTYSFENADSTYLPGQHEPTNGFHELTGVQKAAARAALEYWSNVANVTFVEVADNASGHGDIRFGRSNDPSTAWAYYPSTSDLGGDIWLGNFYHGDTQTYPLGSYYFRTFTHEIGHALGLKHPHDGGGSGVIQNPALDWFGTSLMSYRTYPNQPVNQGDSAFFGPSAPMLNDIAAIQYIYGANTSFRAGNNDYSWAPGARLFETIYDAGGIDSINWSNQSSTALIDLRPGAWSNLGPAYTWSGGGGGSLPTTLAIAYGVTIENAMGGSGNDFITGNTAANTLIGNLGNDTLDGAEGNDRLDGGNGNDRLLGDIGDDRLSGGNGNDDVFGEDGNDFLYGNDPAFANSGIDRMFGGNGNDSAFGGLGNDTIDSGNGNDFVKGDGDSDSVAGGNGNDVLDGDGGNDTIYGGAGNDRILGDVDNDVLYGDDGHDTIGGDDGNDVLFGGAGNDQLRGGRNVDTLTGGTGKDSFVFDDNETGLGALRDRILDFKAAEQDKIDLRLIDANTATGADNPFVWKGAAALTGAGQLGYYVSGGVVVIRGSTDADAASEFEIQLTAGLTPQASWFDL